MTIPRQNNDFTDSDLPLTLFNEWLQDAEKTEINDPNAMALSSVDKEGLPNVRMVLLKEHNEEGFVFYTNFESQKGVEILHNRKAAACFHWKSLRRQVRIRGIVEIVSDAEADAYFKSRPRNSQIGAWASKQSRPLESRFALEKAVAEYGLRFNIKKVERPPYWSGMRIKPIYIEFWRDRPFRLHDRLIFRRSSIHEQNWQKQHLYP